MNALQKYFWPFTGGQITCPVFSSTLGMLFLLSPIWYSFVMLITTNFQALKWAPPELENTLSASLYVLYLFLLTNLGGIRAFMCNREWESHFQYTKDHSVLWTKYLNSHSRKGGKSLELYTAVIPAQDFLDAWPQGLQKGSKISRGETPVLGRKTMEAASLECLAGWLHHWA